MEPITRKEMEEENDAVVVNVLPSGSYEEKHIPGSISIPDGEHFAARIEKTVPDKEEKVIVYCASFDCEASLKAAKKLDELGYTNVMDYEGGVKDWEEAGNALNGARS
jgi:rhodanese-related sulfurtransferase